MDDEDDIIDEILERIALMEIIDGIAELCGKAAENMLEMFWNRNKKPDQNVQQQKPSAVKKNDLKIT